MTTLLEMFERRVAGKCPFCGENTSPEDFRDRTSLDEYRITGLCPKCQDEEASKGVSEE